MAVQYRAATYATIHGIIYGINLRWMREIVDMYGIRGRGSIPFTRSSRLEATGPNAYVRTRTNGDATCRQ